MKERKKERKEEINTEQDSEKVVLVFHCFTLRQLWS